MVYKQSNPGGMRATALLLALSIPLGSALALRAERSSAPAQPLMLETRAVMLPGPVAARAAMRAGPLREAQARVEAEVERGAFPGAALAVGRGERLALIEGIGSPDWEAGKVDPELTVYDVASLTKVIATTTALMLLVEDGRIDLDAPVSRYLPAFSGGEKDRVTVRHLLTHTSGLPAWAPARGQTPEAALESVIRTPLAASPGARMVYSDVGFVVLWAAAEQAAGEPLAELLARRVYAPLGMRSTGFNPGEGCERCSPTWRRGGAPVRGIVHDPIARKLGGVAGNAGLFSTAADLSRFAAMLANGGELQGVRVLEEETIRDFATRQPGAGERALGWETPKANGTGAAGKSLSRRAFGHTGFTGTSLWVDPERRTWTVLLTNRTYDPRTSSRIQQLRRAVHAYVTEAADLSAFAE
jgi:CubicO group peptidase (beta-lactamase class C family)